MVTELTAGLKKADQEIADLRQQLDWFKRNLFGRKSERRIIDLPQEGETLFDLNPQPEPECADENVELEEKVVKKKRRNKCRDKAVNEVGLRFDETVPVETVILANDAAEDIPEDERELVDEHVFHKLAQTPASYRILRDVTPVCKRRTTNEFVSPPAPPAVLEGTCADVSLLAGMLVDKFSWHLPLYRQHARMEAAGIALSRATLTNWSRKAIDLLKPICDAQWASVLQGNVIAMDETGIRAGRVARGKMRQAKFWPVYGERDEIVFHYARDRKHERVPEIPGEFSGVLLSDGYQAYDNYVAARDGAVGHAACWSHTRRAFEKCRDCEPKATEEVLELIWKLFRIERDIRRKRLSGPEKLAVRRERSVPAMAAFREWHGRQLKGPMRLPKDPFLKALTYAGTRRQQLELCLSNPDIPIDTNHLERGVRPIACGRKNWLFAWTEDGAERIATVQSLLFTCQLHGVDPCTWLVDVLQRVSVHPAKRVAELTPRLWRKHFAGNPMRSDLGTGQIVQAARARGSPGRMSRRRRRAVRTSTPSSRARSPNGDSGSAGPDCVALANWPCSSRLLQIQYPPRSKASTFIIVRRRLTKTNQEPEAGSRPSRLRTRPESPS